MFELLGLIPLNTETLKAMEQQSKKTEKKKSLMLVTSDLWCKKQPTAAS